MQYFSDRRLGRSGPTYNFRSMSPAKAWLMLASFALAIAPLAAPLLAASHPLVALAIRSFFSQLCHQAPTRSFVLLGSPAAVCIRCFGIYCGVALAGLVRLKEASGRRLLAAALLLNLLDVAAEMLGWHGSMPAPRFCLGLLLGLGTGAVLLYRSLDHNWE